MQLYEMNYLFLYKSIARYHLKGLNIQTHSEQLNRYYDIDMEITRCSTL